MRNDRRQQFSTMEENAGRPVNLIGGLRESVTLAGVILVSGVIFGLLYNRETTLSYSIGYNLYGAERILDGEVPYRDFTTLYPPATVYLNAMLFWVFGTSLKVALGGVYVFKVVTAATLYLCCRELMPRLWSLAAASFSLIWLRPNGPFKAVPMHYGALFLALSLLLLLRYRRSRSNLVLGMAGAAIGVLAVFKHNIGAYALAGGVLFLAFEQRGESAGAHVRAAMSLAGGFSVPVLAVLAGAAAGGFLGPMAGTLLLGPGEFLIGRLASVPSPLEALLIFGWLGLCLLGAARLSGPTTIAATGAAAVTTPLLLALCGTETINSIVFYLPAVAILTAFVVVASRLGGGLDGGGLLVLAAISTAAYMEAFPRFAREQAIAAMPFIAVVVVFLLFSFRPSFERGFAGRLATRLAVFSIATLLLAPGLRLFGSTFIEGFGFKSNTEIMALRGRGVLFPAAAAAEIDGVVEHIQRRVPENGYFFAQSYAGSAYLFLAGRRNPSSAQFWGGVGVSERDREETLRALVAKNVELVVTSDRDLAAERYAPMREFLSEKFVESARINETVILEAREPTVR